MSRGSGCDNMQTTPTKQDGVDVPFLLIPVSIKKRPSQALKESHINDSGFQIKCLLCGRTFKVYSSFTSHVSRSHPSVSTENAYDCQPVEHLMTLSREMVSIIDSPNQLTSATIESTSNDTQMAVTLPTIQMTAAI